MDIQRVRELINLMNANGLSELEIREEGVTIRLKKPSDEPPRQEIVTLPAPLPMPAAPPAGAPASPAAPAPVPAAAPSEQEVVSPMVGTFYRSPNPEAEVFLSPGDPVEPDTVIGIIEAMKIMNEIPAGRTGVLREFLVVDGEAVEYGQPLATVAPEEA